MYYNVAGWSWAEERKWDKRIIRAAAEMELELVPLKEFCAKCGKFSDIRGIWGSNERRILGTLDEKGI